MILIVESGASKSNWRLYENCGKLSDSFLLEGMNVSTMPLERVKEILSSGLSRAGSDIERFTLYTAGVATDAIKAELTSFINVDIVDIQDDMVAAARALLGHSEGIVAILGTGSNSCFYDGTRVYKKVPSGGYVIGDDGSAAALGKIFLSDYIKNLVPQTLAKDFGASYEAIVTNLYRSDSPSRYLGSLAPMLLSHYDLPYVKEIVDYNFTRFIQRSLKQYDYQHYKVNICGSFAYACRDILEPLMDREGLRAGKFVKDPSQGLAEYEFL